MQGQMDKKVRNYSLGMKQRLGIAMALAREPKLLILDEPTNGLDPAGIEEMRELLRTLADGGVTVMVSSHLLGEIDKSATMLGILSQGRMIFQGTRDELFSAATPDVLIRSTTPAAPVNYWRTARTAASTKEKCVSPNSANAPPPGSSPHSSANASPSTRFAAMSRPWSRCSWDSPKEADCERPRHRE